MSIEIVKKVTESERKAQESKQEAIGNAKRMISDAELAGQELLKEARRNAELQVKVLMTDAEERAAKNEQNVVDETTRACDELRRSAEKRLPAAAELIVRRVVNL